MKDVPQFRSCLSNQIAGSGKKVEVFTRFDADFFKRKSMPFCLFDSVGTLLVINYIFVNFELQVHCTTTFAKDGLFWGNCLTGVESLNSKDRCSARIY